MDSINSVISLEVLIPKSEVDDISIFMKPKVLLLVKIVTKNKIYRKK